MSQGNYKLLEMARVPTGHLYDMTILLALQGLMLPLNPLCCLLEFCPQAITGLLWELMSGVIFSPYWN